jgi:hypothetical protein
MPTPSQNINRISGVLGETLRLTDKSEIVLYHINVSQSRFAIWSERAWTDVDDTARIVWEQAKAQCEAIGGPQKFSLSTFDLSDKTNGNPLRTTVFTVDAPLGFDSEAVSSEPPTGVGLLGQLMRHNQEMARQHSAAIGSLVHHMSKMIEKLSDQNEKYMTDRITMFTTMEDLTSRRHEREIETEKAHASIERNKEIFQKVAAFLPIIANKVVGQPLMHQKFSEFEATALQFIETLTPAKLDAISGSSSWSQDQLLLLGTMLEQSTKMLATPEEKKDRTETAKSAVWNGLVPKASG